jgi:sortase A
MGNVECVRRGLITGVLGRALLSIGVLILLFVAYQLWGTGLVESHSQALLRQRFDAQLHHVTGKHPSPPSSTTTTSKPGDQPTVGPSITAPNDGNPVGVLHITKIGLDKVIVEGTTTDDLRQGPGHYTGTPLPGEAGNAAIAGHRTTYGAPFYNLDRLALGDTIQVTTVQGTFTYRVTRSLVVSPDDTSVVANTTTPELTLTTCNPRFSASQRLVVHAELTSAPAPTARPPKHASTPTASGTSDLAGSQGDWTPALELGALSAVVIVGVFVVARGRRRRVQRWGVYAVGGAASLVALFFFFGALSPLLPASF